MSRAPIIFDIVALFLIAAVPAIIWGVLQASHHKNLKRHRNIQLINCIALLLVISGFELLLRQSNWREAAKISPFYGPGLEEILSIHLICATVALILWLVVPAMAYLKFPHPVRPGRHSKIHRRLGGATVVSTIATALSGWLFYYLAFIAT